MVNLKTASPEYAQGAVRSIENVSTPTQALGNRIAAIDALRGLVMLTRAMAAGRRKQLLIASGMGALALLALLRGFNLYGETLPWVHGESAVRTAMSWLNFTKYPPSLCFLLLTIGAGLPLLAWFESMDNRFTRLCATFGGAPMFYYLLHLYALLLMQAIAVAAFGPTHGSRFGVDHVWMVWLICAAMIPFLYYPCRAFARFKRTTSQKWPRYF